MLKSGSENAFHSEYAPALPDQPVVTVTINISLSRDASHPLTLSLPCLHSQIITLPVSLPAG